MCWWLHVTRQTETRAAGCCVTARSLLCILSIFSMFPEGLGLTTQELCSTLRAQIPLKQNPVSSGFLLFYLLHRELSWKMSSNCKWLAGEPSISINSTVLTTLGVPRRQPCNIHQLLQMQEGLLVAPTCGDDASTATLLKVWCICAQARRESNYLFLDCVSFAVLASVGNNVNPNGWSVKKIALLCKSCLPWEEFKQDKLHRANCRLSSAVFI